MWKTYGRAFLRTSKFTLWIFCQALVAAKCDLTGSARCWIGYNRAGSNPWEWTDGSAGKSRQMLVIAAGNPLKPEGRAGTKHFECHLVGVATGYENWTYVSCPFPPSFCILHFCSSAPVPAPHEAASIHNTATAAPNVRHLLFRPQNLEVAHTTKFLLKTTTTQYCTSLTSPP